MTLNEYTDHFHFRTVIPSDKDNFMSLRREASDIAEAYKEFPDFLDFNWQQILTDENEINMVVFEIQPTEEQVGNGIVDHTDDGGADLYETFVATCSFQKVQESAIELGFDVVADRRGQGIGIKVATELIQLAHKYFPEKEVRICNRDQNIASRRVAEKCGGELIGYEPAPEVAVLEELLAKALASSDPANQMSDDEREFYKQKIEERKKAVRVYRMP